MREPVNSFCEDLSTTKSAVKLKVPMMWYLCEQITQCTSQKFIRFQDLKAFCLKHKLIDANGADDQFRSLLKLFSLLRFYSFYSDCWSEVQVVTVRDGPPVQLTVGELLQQKPQLPGASQLDYYTVEHSGAKDSSQPAPAHSVLDGGEPVWGLSGITCSCFQGSEFHSHWWGSVLCGPKAAQLSTSCSASRRVSLRNTIAARWLDISLVHVPSRLRCAPGGGKACKGCHGTRQVLSTMRLWPRDRAGAEIARLLTVELVPMFGVPEALLSDRGANLVVPPNDQLVYHVGDPQAEHHVLSPSA